jgi:O-antigen/teichoic acid export membrane protein
VRILNSKAWAVVWSAVLQWARVGMNAVVFLVLSRWLSLSEIGVVAAVQAPIIVLQSLVTTMIPDFIVQEKLLTQRRLSSVFWLSVVIGIVLSSTVVLASPLLVVGIKGHNAMPYLLALSICPFAWSLASVFEGLHRRALHTKKLAIRTAFSSTVAGVVAISAGYWGEGGWSIVFFVVLNTIISSFITIFTCDWYPRLELSVRYLRVKRARMLVLTGRHVLGAATIPVISYATAYQLGTTEAGIFQIAFRINSLVDSLIMMPYRFVVMPIFASAKKSAMDLAKQINKAVALGSIIATPFYFGLIIIAPSLIPFVLGIQNGGPCVIAVQLLSIQGVMAAPVNVMNQIMVARGHAIVVFRRSLLMYAFTVIPVVLATLHSVIAVAFIYGSVGGLSGLILTLICARKYLHINVKNVVRTWLRLTMVGAFLLSLYGIYLFTLPAQYLVQISLIISLSPVVYFFTLFLIAKNDLNGLIAAVKWR